MAENIECEEKTYLGSQTKIGLTFGQIITVIMIVSGFAIAWGNMQLKIASLEQKQNDIVVNLNAYDDKSDKINVDMSEIKQTLVRIEGKLELKQDRFK